MVYCRFESNVRSPKETSVQVIEAGAYLRISLDWAGMELGVTRQREDCQRIADRLGWRICDWYIDNNKGASRRSRSKGQRDEEV